MTKQLLLYTFLLAGFAASAQHRLFMDLGAQYNGTVYDRTKESNSNGGGLTLQGRLHNDRSRVVPLLEVTADVFGGTRQIWTLNNTSLAESKRLVIGIYGGAAYYPLRRLFASVAVGPTFISSDAYLAIKPSIGYHFGRQQGFTTRLSLTNTFERNATGNKDFGVVSFGLLFKLFRT